jgi:hypothetical protein
MARGFHTRRGSLPGEVIDYSVIVKIKGWVLIFPPPLWISVEDAGWARKDQGKLKIPFKGGISPVDT